MNRELPVASGAKQNLAIEPTKALGARWNLQQSSKRWGAGSLLWASRVILSS